MESLGGRSGRPAGERLVLRDGSAAVIRPLEPDETGAVLSIFDHMSDEMRYRRFLGYKKRLSARDLEALTAVDHRSHEALVAVAADGGEAIGVARMLRDRRRQDTAEASVAVVDEWQGRGLGSALMERLVARARDEGIRRFTAVLMTENTAMLRVFQRIGAVRASMYGPTLEIEVELPVATGAPAEAVRAAARGDIRG